MGRQWTYGYTGSDLTSATDPMGNKTTYTYGAGSTGNPPAGQRPAHHHRPERPARRPRRRRRHRQRLRRARPGDQPDRPDGQSHHLQLLRQRRDGDCMNTATGTGFTTVTDPDGNTTVDSYTAGALTGQAKLQRRHAR